ncbi:MAG: hypothetical protein ACLRYD_06590 [Ruminococcus callidus]
MNLSVHISGFGQMFGVPNAVVDQYLKLATPSQLKVLLYLLRSNRPNLAHDEIAKALGIPEELVEEAVLFWSQTTLFTVEEQSAEQPQKPRSSPQPDRLRKSSPAAASRICSRPAKNAAR